MIVIRRRLIFWLIKAYIKKSGKTILFSFLAGLIIFGLVVGITHYFNKAIPIYKKVNVGVVGAYTQNNLPTQILEKMSRGLTRVDDKGNITPDLAKSWKILNNGKTYVFYLKPNQYFSDGREVTSSTVNYNFSDVSKQKLGKYELAFKLSESYAPFLATVSQPVFENGLTGVGPYELTNIQLNGSFVQTLTLASIKNRLDIIQYQFYPTEDTLKLAFLLGNISEADGLSTPTYNNIQFATFPHTKTYKYTDYSSLVTLFYNTNDQDLSDKRMRLALSYTIPNSFIQGVKAYGPYASDSIFYDKDLEEDTQDYKYAKLLLSETNIASSSAAILPTLTITTLPVYMPAAKIIASSWLKLGFHTKIIETDTIPSQFQIFLGDFIVPKDPDQYVLWHSGQEDNITRINDVRLDKLLEEGRNTIDQTQREQIYYDFQKYLMDDQPATFLYFPYTYIVKRN